MEITNKYKNFSVTREQIRTIRRVSTMDLLAKDDDDAKKEIEKRIDGTDKYIYDRGSREEPTTDILLSVEEKYTLEEKK